MHSPCFLPTVHDPAPPSLHRVLAARVPRLPRYYEVLRLPAVPRAALRCLRLALPPAAPVFVSPVSPTPAPGLGFSGLATPYHLRVETTGSPKFLGDPHAPMPCSLTPAGPNAAGPCAALAWPPLIRRRRLPRGGNFGAQWHGLGARCLRFVQGVTRPGRKTRFWVLARLSQAGFGPAESLRKVSKV
jgi:hypothetical protein